MVPESRQAMANPTPERRIKVASDSYRVPDVVVSDRAFEKEQVLTRAPLAVFEVLSPTDTGQDLDEKLGEYAAMGIAQIWVVDPKPGCFAALSMAVCNPPRALNARNGKSHSTSKKSLLCFRTDRSPRRPLTPDP